MNKKLNKDKVKNIEKLKIYLSSIENIILENKDKKEKKYI
jgi:hypothetical protein